MWIVIRWICELLSGGYVGCYQVMWVYFGRKREKCVTQRTVSLGTSQFGD